MHLGIHVLLEEVGAQYELQAIDLFKGEQKTPEYRAINPKGKVPALLRPDGSLLPEWPAIATWLALAPRRSVCFHWIEGMARTVESVDYIVATLHMQGFTRIWRPDHFTSRAEDIASIKQNGRDILK